MRIYIYIKHTITNTYLQYLLAIMASFCNDDHDDAHGHDDAHKKRYSALIVVTTVYVHCYHNYL